MLKIAPVASFDRRTKKARGSKNHELSICQNTVLSNELAAAANRNHATQQSQNGQTRWLRNGNLNDVNREIFDAK